MLFDRMKVTVGTIPWRTPNCVLQIPALNGNDRAENHNTSPPTRAHLAFFVWKDVMLQLPFLGGAGWHCVSRACRGESSTHLRSGFSLCATAPWASSGIGIVQRS